MPICSDVISYLTFQRDMTENKYAKSAYQKVINELRDAFEPSDNITLAKLNKLPLTDNMKEKILTMSSPQRSSEKMSAKKSPKAADEKNGFREDLIKIMGIGEKMADALISAGVKNMDDLEKHMDKLPASAKTYLALKPQTQIPYNDAKKIFDNLPKAGIPVGSYRRGKSVLRDLDLVVVADTDTKWNNYIKALEKSVTSMTIYAKGSEKISCIIQPKLPKALSSKKFKLDIFKTTTESKFACIVYATGSKEFNISMRRKAKSLGYKLNQIGLFKGEKMVPIKSEKDLFKKLDMSYSEPELRI